MASNSLGGVLARAYVCTARSGVATAVHSWRVRSVCGVAGVPAGARRMSMCLSRPLACCPGGFKPEAQPTSAADDATGAGVAAPAGATAAATRRTGKRYRLRRIYSELAKARLSALVVGSAGAGFLLVGAPLSAACVQAAAALSVGTYLCAASANTFNQLYEVKTDGLMARTRARPLPSGRITPAHAAAFGVATGAAGTALLCVVNSPLVAALGAANILLYAGVYTPLKQVSTLNTTVGAVVGAIPPLMGWAAGAALVAPSITSGLSVACLALPDPWLLGAVLLAWQYPHFLSLSYLHRRDYAGGGHVMHSVVDPSGGLAARIALVGGLALTAAPLAAVAAGAASPLLAVESLVLNGYALKQMLAFAREQTDGNARAVFRTSLWYLPLLMGLMVAHSTHNKAGKREESPVNAARGAGTLVAATSSEAVEPEVAVGHLHGAAIAPSANRA